VYADHTPPGKKGAVVVYKWEKVDGFRKQVDRCDIEDLWYTFSNAQQWYDSFCNEWDLHPEFSPGKKWYDLLPLDQEDDEHPIVTSTVRSSCAKPSSNSSGNYSQPEPCLSPMVATSTVSGIQHISSPFPTEPTSSFPVSVAIPIPHSALLEMFNPHGSDSVLHVMPLLVTASGNQPTSTISTHDIEVTCCTSFTNSASHPSHCLTIDEHPAKHQRHSSCTASSPSHPMLIPYLPQCLIHLLIS
jgi:hypothetical protein